MSRELCHQQEALWELLTTELIYVRKLKIMTDVSRPTPATSPAAPPPGPILGPLPCPSNHSPHPVLQTGRGTAVGEKGQDIKIPLT